MEIKKILWLEDEGENFSAYRSTLFRAGYLVDVVESISDAIKKLREENYVAVIFDIKVLPGDDPGWIALDQQKLKENPDSYLGLELMCSLFKPEKANVPINPPIRLDPKKVIVFSVVFDKGEEIASFGIPDYQRLYKSSTDPKTLLKVIESIQNRK